MTKEDLELELKLGPKEVTVELICKHCSEIISEEYKEFYREEKPTVAKGHCWACIRVGAGAGNETILICRSGCGPLFPRIRALL